MPSLSSLGQKLCWTAELTWCATTQENYGRAKETHAHTQALWEKEIRRARKETFKAQSSLVKLQEELKSCKMAQKACEAELEHEKERSKAREQEAFAARYSLVGFQEQLEQALERVKMLEQERDAFKTLAKNEEDLARIAAEGKLPLPVESSQGEEESELEVSKRQTRVSSLALADVKSSVVSEMEIEELTRLWQWEKQRADRALEQVEFLEAECHLKTCPAAKAVRVQRTSIGPIGHRKRASHFAIADAMDLVILSEKAAPSSPAERQPSPKRTKTDMLREENREKEPRRSTVFVPAEGIFRTVTQEETEALNGPVQQTLTTETSTSILLPSEPPTPSDGMPSVFARTPSVEPPDFAIPAQLPRISLLSLLDAPHRPEPPLTGFHVPTTPGPIAALQQEDTPKADVEVIASEIVVVETEHAAVAPSVVSERVSHAQSHSSVQSASSMLANPPAVRPHTSAACYTNTVTTTTKVPLREETKDPSLASRLMKLQRTPSRSGVPDKPSFDVNNPALTPTMTREQALAQIRERRGRARSVGKVAPSTTQSQPVVTPRRQMVDKERREVSAPTARVTPLGVTPARRVRS